MTVSIETRVDIEVGHARQTLGPQESVLST